MSADPASITLTLMSQDVEAQEETQQAHTTLVSADGAALEDVKPKTPGSSRRGKQYKCGHCHELGHNQKTCPRRGAGAPDQPSIQPALVDSELFGHTAVALQTSPENGHTTSSPSPPTGGASAAAVAAAAAAAAAVAAASGPQTTMPTSCSPVVTPTTSPTTCANPRVSPAKLDDALEAAQKRVFAADRAVSTAGTDGEFVEALRVLEVAVSHLDRIARCAQQCAEVAHRLADPVGGGVFAEQDDGSAQQHHEEEASGERLRKRAKIDARASAAAAAVAAAASGLAPTTLAFNEATAGAAGDMDGGVAGSRRDKDRLDCD